uniref:Uncharacterized protein n=1 Tax=Vespula pensylvanica TaxID=30213 RepID=A0A834P2B2_VESPE|nr:hypothetical protein H0235_007958 [Vespula pensylvanica]
MPSLSEDQSGQRRYSTIGKIQTWRSGRVRVTKRNFRALEGERFKVNAEVASMLKKEVGDDIIQRRKTRLSKSGW